MQRGKEGIVAKWSLPKQNTGTEQSSTHPCRTFAPDGRAGPHLTVPTKCTCKACHLYSLQRPRPSQHPSAWNSGITAYSRIYWRLPCLASYPDLGGELAPGRVLSNASFALLLDLGESLYHSTALTTRLGLLLVLGMTFTEGWKGKLVTPRPMSQLSCLIVFLLFTL